MSGTKARKERRPLLAKEEAYRKTETSTVESRLSGCVGEREKAAESARSLSGRLVGDGRRSLRCLQSDFGSIPRATQLTIMTIGA